MKCGFFGKYRFFDISFDLRILKSLLKSNFFIFLLRKVNQSYCIEQFPYALFLKLQLNLKISTGVHCSFLFEGRQPQNVGTFNVDFSLKQIEGANIIVKV